MKRRDKTKEELLRQVEEMRRVIAKLQAFKEEEESVAEELKESEERFRKLAEKSVVGIYPVISATTMTKVVPVFVAAMILLIRVLLIGTFSVAGDRLLTSEERRTYNNAPRPAQQQQTYRPASQPILRPASSINRPVQTNNTYRPAPKPAQQTSFTRPEPTYHNLSFNGQADSDRPLDA